VKIFKNTPIDFIFLGFLFLSIITAGLSCRSYLKPEPSPVNITDADLVSNPEAEKFAQGSDRTYFPLFLESLQSIKNNDDRLLFEYINNYSRIPVPGDQIHRDQFEKYSREIIPVCSDSRLSRTGFPVTFPIKWNDTVQKDLTWHLYLQTLNWVRPFLKSENPDTLITGLKIVNDWILAHTDYPDKDEYLAFNDHAASERMLVLHYTFERYKQENLEIPQFEKILILSILCHTFLCGSLEKYNSNTNHGIIMDRNLIILMSGFEIFNKREDFIQLAFKRVWELFRKSFTAEGVHKEHSPFYHSWVAKDLNELIIKADSMHLPVPDVLRTISDRALDYTNNLQINGIIPPIGDYNYDQTNKSLKLPLPLLNDLKIYPHSGWAFIRDSINKSVVIIHSDFFSKVHYQQDETSFLLNADGHNLIIDPGLYSYTPGTEFYKYMVSARAHNVLMVDNLEFEPDVAQTGLSGISRFYANDQGNTSTKGIIELTHPHYNKIGVEIYRQFAFPGNNLFIINDIANSDTTHVYSQLFHLAPGAVIMKTGDEFNISWPDHSHSLQIKSNEDDNLVVEGQKEPLQGWYFPEFLQPAPAPVLILMKTAKDLNFKTTIEVLNSDERPGISKKEESEIKSLYKKLENIDRTELKYQPFPKLWRPARN
jgi:hypothetical protein